MSAVVLNGGREPRFSAEVVIENPEAGLHVISRRWLCGVVTKYVGSVVSD